MKWNGVVSGLMMMVASQAIGAEALPRLKLAADITVSGISSGAYMANQFHLAHAEQVVGVGLIAGGPYDCAQGSLSTALARCVGKADAKLDVGHLLQRARQRASNEQLALETAWSRARVWLFHGTLDTTVARTVSDQLAQFYAAVVKPEQLRYVNQIATAHSMPTRSKGNPCNTAETPFISACQYDAAGEMLGFLLGTLQPAVTDASGRVLKFDQANYAPSGELTLADEGYVYIPKRCDAGSVCKLHIAFHGCQQFAGAIGERFVREAGYNEWADSNDLVILYPQTESSMLPLNPKGCWDWWGYTDEHYATRKGNQIATVAAMVQALRQ